MKGRGRGVTELVTYKTVKRAHSADRRQGRERANKGTRGKMRRQGGEDKAEVGVSFGRICTLSESDQRTLWLLLGLRLRIWDMPERCTRQPSKPSAKPSTETQTRVRSKSTATTTKRGRRRVIREHRHPERVRLPLCIGHLRPQSVGRAKSRSESASQSSRQRLL